MEEKIQLDIEITKQDGFTILTPKVKELTFKNSREFLNRTKEAFSDGNVRAILCMKHIEIIDSMSLGTLMAVLKHARKSGGELVVTDLSDPIRELFRLLNFTSVFRTFPSVEAALNEFSA